MPKIRGEVERARELHGRGRGAEAEAILRRRLSTRPGDGEALCLLALLRAGSGAFAEARRLALAATEADPRSAAAWRLLGQLQLETGDAEAALGSFGSALAQVPGDPESLFGQGNALRRLGHHEAALRSFGQALATAPGQPAVLCNMGNTLQDLGRFREALECFEQALAAQPGAPILQYNRGNALLGLGRAAEAADSFDAVLRQLPDHADAWNNRGNALMETGQFEQALQSFDRALVLRPDFPDARINRGNALLELDRVDQAEAEFAAVTAADPGDAAAHNGLGMALQRGGDLDAAGASFSKALELDAGFDEARHNLALLRLFRHDFARAWDDYESRLQIPGYRHHMRKQPDSVDLFKSMPRWSGPGTAISGTVAVWAEQGIGDQILFSTLMPELCSGDGHFLFEVDSRLIGAYRRSFPGASFVGFADPPAPALTTAAAAVFAGSLPRWFRGDRASFASQPRSLLQALPGHVAGISARLGEGFRVALSWRSARKGWIGPNKSVALDVMSPLLETAGVSWVNVQYGDTAGERRALEERRGIRLHHFDDIDYRDDLESVLALLECCDLLITTSNASAHLAGALGKPVWLLYPGERAPFHYWAHGGDHRCLWYPSVEIVSAPQLDDWPKLVDHVAARLRALVAGRT